MRRTLVLTISIIVSTFFANGQNPACDYQVMAWGPGGELTPNEVRLPAGGGSVVLTIQTDITTYPTVKWYVNDVEKQSGSIDQWFDYNYTHSSNVRAVLEGCTDPIAGLFNVFVNSSGGGGGGGGGGDYCHPPTGDEESVQGGMIMIEDNFCPGQTSKFRFNFGDEMERFSWSLTGGEFAAGSNQYSENPAVNWHANSGTIRIDGYFCDGGTTKLFWQEESYEMTTGTVSADEDECLPMVRLEYSGAWDEIDHWERSTSSSTGPWTAFSYTQDSQIPVSTRTWYRAMALGRAGTCTGGIIPSNVVVVDIDNFCSTYEIVHNQPPENFDGNELKLPSNGGNVRFGTTGIPAGHEVVFEVYVAGELAQDRIVGDYRSEFSYNFDSDSEVRIFVECCSNPIYGLISVNVGGTGGGDGGDGSDYCHPPTGGEASVRGGMIMIEDNFCPGQTSKFRFNFGDEMERFSWSLTGGEFAAGSNQYSENPAVNWHANSGKRYDQD